MRIDRTKLGRTIKAIRSDLKITQKELAEKSGLTINYISLLENGKRGIGFGRLNDLAEIFGIPAELLIILASNGHHTKNKEAKRLLQQIQLITRQAIDLYVSCL